MFLRQEALLRQSRLCGLCTKATTFLCKQFSFCASLRLFVQTVHNPFFHLLIKVLFGVLFHAILTALHFKLVIFIFFNPLEIQI